MSHNITAYLDSDVSNAETKTQDWTVGYGWVEEPEPYHNSPRKDGTVQGYVEIRGELAITESLADAVSELKTAVSDASWGAIHSRRDDSELADESWRDDASYYDATLSDGLRAPVEMSFDGHTLSYEDIHYLHDGTEQTIPAGEMTFDPPNGEVISVTVNGNDNGELVETGGTEIATLELHPGRIANLDPATQPQIDEESWTAEAVWGSPPTHFADYSTPFPERMDPQPVDRNYISPETAQAIRDARSAGDVEAQLDHVLDILDVIDLSG